MLRLALALALVHSASAGCPKEDAETPEEVCNKLSGTRYDAIDDSVSYKFFGVWDTANEECKQCDWGQLGNCINSAACDDVKVSSADSGKSVWDSATETCSKCSEMDVTGCDSQADCESMSVYNKDKDVMSFGVWTDIPFSGGAGYCQECSWDNLAGCNTPDKCACVSQRPEEYDDGRAVWDPVSLQCKLCSTSSFDGCNLGTDIFHQGKCQLSKLAKRKEPSNAWSCSNNGKKYTLSATKDNSIELADVWVYGAAVSGLVIALLNTCCFVGLAFRVYAPARGKPETTITTTSAPAKEGSRV